MFQGFLDLFLQSNCPLCQRSTSDVFCENCTRQLHKCHHTQPNILWKPPTPVFSWGVYGGNIKRAIAVMKYDNQPQIARPLGQWLGKSWLLHSLHQKQQIVVVPIPLHASKQKQRGYNQAALIAQSFCQTTGLKLKVNGLARVRETQAQFGLSASDRKNNLAEAFALGVDFRDRRPQTPVLLVDDIYTTGATFKSAVQILRQSGIVVLGLAAIATPVNNRDTKN